MTQLAQSAQSDVPVRLYMFQTGTLKCKTNNIKMNADPAPYDKVSS